MKNLSLLLFLSLIINFAVPPAQALTCKQIYKLGYRNASSYTKAAFDRVKCRKTMLNIVYQTLSSLAHDSGNSLAPGWSNHQKLCFYDGWCDALFHQMDIEYDRCQSYDCFDPSKVATVSGSIINSVVQQVQQVSSKQITYLFSKQKQINWCKQDNIRTSDVFRDTLDNIIRDKNVAKKVTSEMFQDDFIGDNDGDNNDNGHDYGEPTCKEALKMGRYNAAVFARSVFQRTGCEIHKFNKGVDVLAQISNETIPGLTWSNKIKKCFYDGYIKSTFDTIDEMQNMCFKCYDSYYHAQITGRFYCELSQNIQTPSTTIDINLVIHKVDRNYYCRDIQNPKGQFKQVLNSFIYTNCLNFNYTDLINRIINGTF